MPVAGSLLPGDSAPGLFDARLPLFRSTSRPLLPCARHKRQWWSTLHPMPAVFQAPTPVVELLAPAPALSEAPAPGVEFIAPSDRTQFFLSLSHQRLQMQRHTSRLSLAPRVERAFRLLQVLCRDAVLWTRPATCMTCRWSGSSVLPWRAWSTGGDARKSERNSWRGLCCISVMSCSRAQVMGIQ